MKLSTMLHALNHNQNSAHIAQCLSAQRTCSLYLVGIGGLVVERERHGVRERPLQQGVVLAGQNFDVHGYVGSFAGTVAVQEQRGL